jgi:hypothetical protein
MLEAIEPEDTESAVFTTEARSCKEWETHGGANAAGSSGELPRVSTPRSAASLTASN